MLSRLFYLLFILLLVWPAVVFPAAESTPSAGLPHVGVMVFPGQILSNQGSFDSAKQKIDLELSDHYSAGVGLKSVKQSYKQFMAGFDAQYESYILGTMKHYQLDYLIFSQVYPIERRLSVNCFNKNGEQVTVQLPYNEEVRENFSALAPGLYLSLVNYFSSAISQNRIY